MVVFESMSIKLLIAVVSDVDSRTVSSQPRGVM